MGRMALFSKEKDYTKSTRLSPLSRPIPVRKNEEDLEIEKSI
jgi:hypothetical protein